MEEERERSRTERNLHMALKGRTKVRRLAVDRLTSAPTKGKHIFASRAEQEKHAQLQVSVFTTSCSLPGEKGRKELPTRSLLRTDKD